MRHSAGLTRQQPTTPLYPNSPKLSERKQLSVFTHGHLLLLPPKHQFLALQDHAAYHISDTGSFGMGGHRSVSEWGFCSGGIQGAG